MSSDGKIIPSGLYQERIFGADARLVLLLCLSVAVLVVDNILTLAGLFGLLFFVFVLSGVGWRRFSIWMLLCIAAFWGFVVTQSLFYPYKPRTLLFEILSPDTPFIGGLTGGIAVYLEGFVHGALQSLRFLTLITAGLTLVWSTPPHELLRGLRKLGVPHRAAFMVTTALRFIPTIGSEARAVLAAMRVRGYPLKPTRPWRYLRALAVGLAPILHRNMRRAAMLADSLESRGFLDRGKIKSSTCREFMPANLMTRKTNSRFNQQVVQALKFVLVIHLFS